MTTPKRPHDISSDEYRAKNQDDLDEKNRRSALVVVLEHLQRQQLDGAAPVELIHLVDELELEEALDELAGSRRTHAERHRRLAAARLAADQVDDLDGADDLE